MGRKRGFLGFLATLIFAFSASNVFAATYTCSSDIIYESCKSGYYMTTDGGATFNGIPTAGNRCVYCSTTGNNGRAAVTCPGGVDSPVYRIALDYNDGGSAVNVGIFYSESMGGYCSTSGYCRIGGTELDSLPIPTHRTTSTMAFSGYYTAASGGMRCTNSNGVIQSNATCSVATTWYAHWSSTLNCDPGYYANGTTCSVCPRGYYCLGGAGVAPKQCPYGYRANPNTGVAYPTGCQALCQPGKIPGIPGTTTCISTMIGGWATALSDVSAVAFVNWGSWPQSYFCPNDYISANAASSSVDSYHAAAYNTCAGTIGAGNSPVSASAGTLLETINISLSGITDVPIIVTEVKAFDVDGAEIDLRFLMASGNIAWDSSEVLFDDIVDFEDMYQAWGRSLPVVTDVGFVFQSDAGLRLMVNSSKPVAYVQLSMLPIDAMDLYSDDVLLSIAAQSTSSTNVLNTTIGFEPQSVGITINAVTLQYNTIEIVNTNTRSVDDSVGVLSNFAVTTRNFVIAGQEPCAKNTYRQMSAVPPLGAFGAFTLQCSACSDLDSGFYTTTSATGATSADMCYGTTTAGKYVATAGAGQTDCPVGAYCTGNETIYYGPTAGKVISSNISACATGYIQPDTGQSSCKPCLPGTFQPNTGQTECLVADSGYYVPDTGASSQTLCAFGQYQPNTGQSSCFTCPDTPDGYQRFLASDIVPDSSETQAQQIETRKSSWAMCGLVSTAPASGCATAPLYGMVAQDGADFYITGIRLESDEWVASDGHYVEPYTDENTVTTCPICPAGSVCSGNTVMSCADLGGGLYNASDAGASDDTDCYATVTAGNYLASSADTAVAPCPSGDYCMAEKIYWPNVSVLNDGGWNNCPAADTHKRTTFPENYYNPTITTTVLTSSSGYREISNCRVIIWYSNARGNLFEYATYNQESGLYDVSTGTYGWADVNPGYYLEEPASCGQFAYYYQALECPANSFCPGKTRVVCNSSNQSTVHTETFGLENCPTGYTYNTVAGKSAAEQCQIWVGGGKFLKVAGESSPTGTCAAGYAKAAHAVNYGSVSACDACVGATYAENTGQTSCTVCPVIDGAMSYDYWNTGAVGDHTTYQGCNATFGAAALAHGDLASYSCYADAGLKSYGVTGDSKGCWILRRNLKCDTDYYNKIFNSDITTNQDFTYDTSAALLAGACVAVGDGYWSPDQALTRSECTNSTATDDFTYTGSGNGENDCPWVCNDGYNLTADGLCGQFCTAGVTHIKLGTGLSIPLYNSAQTSPAIHVKYNNQICYGNLEENQSSSALNIRMPDGTYWHSVD